MNKNEIDRELERIIRLLNGMTKNLTKFRRVKKNVKKK
jgi:hypothetical protein